MRVVLVDDHVLIRQALAEALTTAGFDVVGQTGSIAETLAIVRRTAPDVAVIDLNLSDARTDSGLIVAEHLARAHPAVGLLILSGYDEDAYVDRLLAIRDTGRGYALKGSRGGIPALLEAIRQVGEGGSYLDDRLRERLAERTPDAPAPDPLEGLSPHDLLILRLLSEETLTNEAIARELRVKTNTVEKRITKIFTKLDYNNPGRFGPDRNSRMLAGLIYLQHRPRP